MPASLPNTISCMLMLHFWNDKVGCSISYKYFSWGRCKIHWPQVTFKNGAIPGREQKLTVVKLMANGGTPLVEDTGWCKKSGRHGWGCAYEQGGILDKRVTSS